MKKINKLLGTRGVSLSLFVLAGLLLLGSTVGGTQAALAEFSQTYTAEFEQKHIGVTLNEDGEPVASRNFVEDSDGQWSGNVEGTLLGSQWLAKNDLRSDEDPEGEPIKLGYAYPYALSVTNTGNINEYVRVTVYKYWMHEVNGRWEKDTGVDPELIRMEWNEGSGWTIDESAGTRERTVLYYGPVLGAGESSAPLTRSFTIDSDLGLKVREEPAGENVVNIIYEYDGYRFVIEATVDAVQDHNKEQAMIASWGTTGP